MINRTPPVKLSTGDSFLKIEIDTAGLERFKQFTERRMRAVVATTLTRTAVQVRTKVQDHANSVLDRPTPYTVRQLRYVAATADKPVAAVGFNIVAIQDKYGNVVRYEDLGPDKTPAGKYLHFQTEGGQRAYKRFEMALASKKILPPGYYAVPGDRAKMDAYGNHDVGEIRQILSWFDVATQSAGYMQNMGDRGRERRRKGTKKKAGFEYVAIFPGARGGLLPGIYRRTFFALGKRIEPIVIFVSRANYRKRFDFYNVSLNEARRLLPGEFDRAMRESAARLAAK